ncbi:DUF305 domain-containing protein [Actinophytocola oryzae]|uniref:Uncharacterized protein (DUF305 family) n=1 Tax=Actinophytocola oryzae TaxID=502181 RepID=A0A4R7VVD4_9PSEU|nr:DUF305 domain-containing protein [Actinophytocola oryzae]TDV53970.1 uncharacterized protein (DUF305 family) [Actinophytocola oryzae]
MTDQRTRNLILVAGMVAMLVVGAAIGMMISTFRTGGDEAAPSAESVDVGFAQDMRMHHLQAVTMAGIERDRTDDPMLRGIAFDIESTQLSQASEMAGWLTVWVQPSLPAPGAGHMEWMSEGGTHSHSNGEGGKTTGAVQRMPGMASTDELNRLRKASGAELDVMFLQLMLRHHQGGREMAEYAAQHASKGYVRNLASKIVQSQDSESNQMKTLLAQRGAKPLPAS